MSKRKPSQSNIVVHKTEITQGPLPSPNTLSRYNDIVPGAAERIIQMAENQANHRMELEKTVINADINKSKLGQVLGFVLAIVVVGIGFTVIMLDKNILGFGIIIGDLSILCGVFVVGTISRSRERKRKREYK